MAGTVLDVEPLDFLTASEFAGSAARSASGAGARLQSALGSSSHMAGSDPAGLKWAAQYDQVTGDVIRGLDSLETVFGQIAAGLSVTGLNYATADWLSSGKAGHAPGFTVPSLPAAVCSAGPPSAAGGTGGCTIPGWEYVAGFIGDMWPDGDTGKLRAAKGAWNTFADDLDTVQGALVPKITAALDGNRTPELPTITEAISTVRSGVGRLADEARNLGTAAGQLADQIDSVHQQTEQVLIQLGEQIAATAAIGIGLTIVTAGLSDAAGALAAGGEVAVAVSRILTFIVDLGSSVSRVVDTIATSAASLAKVGSLTETITIRIVTIAGKSVVTGVGGAVTNVGVAEITDPGGADLGDAALQGLVGGAAFGAVAEGGGMLARSPLMTRLFGKNADAGGLDPKALATREPDVLDEAELSTLRGPDHSAAIFGPDLKPFYEVAQPRLGVPGRPFFVMPSRDAAEIRNASDAARQTGMSPSTQKAYINGDDVYALVFPKTGIPHRVPVTADAGGWAHYLSGGHTAVRLEGPKAGYLLNETHESVIPGGTLVPSGSVLVRIANGHWELLRRIQ